MIKMLTVTDIGLRRTTNQDTFACAAEGESPLWALVCDGMGGHAAGNIAAEMARNSLTKALQNGLRPDMSERSLRLLMETAVENAGSAIYQRTLTDPQLQGMGTTLVAAVVQGGQVFLCHAGDSRAYLVRQDMAQPITKDHSVVQQLIDRGEITPKQAKTHPERHLITKALGVADHRFSPEFTVCSLQPGDLLLLCTDGLHGMVDQSELAPLCHAAVAEGSAQGLAQRANQMGGSDNITAVLLYNF